MMRNATLLLAAAAAACGGGAAPGSGGQVVEADPRPVRTARVERTEAGGERSMPATVEARQSAVLSSRLSASVLELPVLEGRRAARGAVLVRLDDGALRAAEVAAVTASETAAADLRRLEALLARDAATPSERDRAAARAAEAEAAVQAARDALAYAVLRAPFAGSVARRHVKVGDVVNPGIPLLELEGDAGLELVAGVDAADAAALQPGQEVAAEVDGAPGRLTATLRSVAASADPGSHRVEIRAALPRAEGVRAGLFGRLWLPGRAAEARLLVPESAVVTRGGLSGLFVVEEGHARLRWVALAPADAGRVEVRAGVEAGERVALEPEGLSDGMPVRDAS